MSAFKFSCPSCGQHLSIDSTCSGAQIACPACQEAIVIPGPEPAAPAGAGRLSLSPPAAGPRTPSSPGFSPPRPGAPPRTSGWAVASLVCSIGSFLFLPFGFIPGIICGHVALKRIRATPGLGGHGIAKTGLVIGYISLSLFTLVIAGFIGMMVFAGRSVMKELDRKAVAQDQSSAAPLQSNSQPEAGPVDKTPDAAGWTLDLSALKIPSTPVAGRIHGQPFTLQKMAYDGGFLKFMQGSDFFADLEMDVVLFAPVNRLGGKTYTSDKSTGTRPHIYMHWKDPANKYRQQSWVNDYALRIEFGQLQNGRLPGKIYLCVPDPDKSFIRGTFELPVGR